MSSSDSEVGASIGRAAIASSTAVDLAARYADLDDLWKTVTADAAAASGQPSVRSAVQAYGERHASLVVALMAHTGALGDSVDAAAQSSVDSDQANTATFGQVLGALSLAPASMPGK